MSCIDLEKQLILGREGGVLYLGDCKEQATQLLQNGNPGVYQSHIQSAIICADSMVTFNPADFENALKVLKESRQNIKQLKRKVKIMGKENFDDYTREEILAELLYNESTLLLAIVSFFSNENWTKFAKFGLKIRKLYYNHKRCHDILKKRTWDPSNAVEAEFMAGVHMSVGGFYLILCFLPEAVKSILKVFGLSVTVEMALRELNKGYDLKSTARSTYCGVILISYHLILRDLHNFTPIQPGEVQRILQPIMDEFPTAAFTSLMLGKLEMSKGNPEEAIQKLNNALQCFHDRRFARYLANIYKLFCIIYISDYNKGYNVTSQLIEDDRFTKVNFVYFNACFLYVQEKKTPGQVEELNRLMQSVPKMTFSIAGITPPIQKFVANRAKQFLKNRKLVVPLIEFLYLYKGFDLISKNPVHLNKIVIKIESDFELVKNVENYLEEICSLLVMKSSCLKFLGKLEEAEKTLISVLQSEKDIKLDTHIVPMCYFELGQVKIMAGHKDEGIKTLNKALSFSGYLMEFRLKLRIRSSLEEVNAIMKREQRNNSIMPDISEDIANIPDFD